VSQLLNQETIAMLQDVLGEDFPEVIDAFIGDTPKRIDDMRAAAASKDAVALEGAVHAVKGSSANIGATEVFNHASFLVDNCRAGQLDDAVEQVETLVKAFESVKIALLALK
jgi:HPt (histidine-containing phosphotransfer) domain-containing protein